jgi:hypothetical protein
VHSRTDDGVHLGTVVPEPYDRKVSNKGVTVTVGGGCHTRAWLASTVVP